jgi:hypothetical protein
MAHGLRIETFRWLAIDRSKLSPKIGCGMVLEQVPKFYASDTFNKVFASYDINSIYADKPAQALLQTENIVKHFCMNAFGSLPLNENFRTMFAKHQIILLIDKKVKSAWFIGSIENRLPFINYYREIIPNIFKEIDITLSGSLMRILPIGWQNLYDFTATDFLKYHRQVKTIEILSVITDARWRSPVLSLGINLLNLMTPDTIRDKVLEVLK